MSTGIAMLGTGAFGRFCLDAFSKMPEVRIVAVYDVDLARAQEIAQFYNAQAYDSLEAMLNQPDVQIVALNTPPYLHAEQGMHILEAGKHLFCEKPLALTLADAEKLIALAESKHLLLTVDYVMRHNPLWQLVARFRETGIFGKPRHMDLANHAAGLSLPDNHWFWDKAKSGGIWLEHGVHFFDAFAMAAGESGEIIAAQSFQDSWGNTDRVEALAHYGSCAAHFYHAFDQSSSTEQTIVQITFEMAYLSLREWIPTEMKISAAVSADLMLADFHAEKISQQNSEGRYLTNLKLGSKSAIYQQCIQAGMRDLVASIANPQKPLIVQSRFAVESLRMALDAEGQ
jgi:predicted dehydrogenase